MTQTISWLDQYVRELFEIRHFSPSSIYRYRQNIQQFVRYLEGNKTDLNRAEDCQISDCEAYFVYLKVEKKYTRHSLQNSKNALSSYWSWMKLRGFLKDNPFKHIVLSKFLT